MLLANATTCPRQWRISVDNDTIAFGTAVSSRALPALSSRAVSVSGVAVTGWSAGRECVLDPAAVLSADLLAKVVALLSVRERLQCATLSRAWRRVVAPVPPALLSACVWELVDLNPLGPECSAKLSNHVLPRWGNHIRELSLRRTLVDDDSLRAVVAGCPLLRHLDVGRCYRVFNFSCERPNVNVFSELMLQLYARALPQQYFTLLMYGSGFTSGCNDCARYCDGYVQLVSNSLEMALAWSVKPRGLDSAEIPRVAWLQCDLMVCKNWNSAFSDHCDLFY